MESQSQKIIRILEEILPLMKLDSAEDVTYYHDYLAFILDKLNKPHDIVKIAENIMLAYGGMYKMEDINLYKDDIPLVEEHLRFSKLRTELHTACEDIIVEDRNK